MVTELQEKSLSSSALGDNFFYLLPMEGRVLIDMMKAVQANPGFKLESYSLNSVAAAFMRGDVKQIESVDGGTRVTTKKTDGLRNGSWVTFLSDNGIIQDTYQVGRKFQLRDVTPTSFVTDTPLDMQLDGELKYSWSESKDDISAKDIFRMQFGSSADRALVAKYCVQDCELVSRLMLKLDIVSNAMAMSSVCHVPLSYLFLRGQGVKIYSLVSSQVSDLLIYLSDKSILLKNMKI